MVDVNFEAWRLWREARPVAPAIPMLDHGYIKLVDAWGTDEGFIEAARQSTGKGFEGWGGLPTCVWCKQTREERGPNADGRCLHNGGGLHEFEPGKPGDERLLGYLFRNGHSTPFEMGGMQLEIQAPIFVFREWHRHRTQSYSEMSARYIQMPDLHYVPTLARLTPPPSTNKQASGIVNTVASPLDLQAWLADGTSLDAAVYAHYDRGLKLGVPREVARIHTPVNRYSRMRAQALTLNWIRFFRLRWDNAAQLEIRQYAEVAASLFEGLFPRTFALYVEERAAK